MKLSYNYTIKPGIQSIITDIVDFVGDVFGCQDFWKYQRVRGWRKGAYIHSLQKGPDDIRPNTGIPGDWFVPLQRVVEKWS